jgi:peptidoglycan/xylan/chitin deacetylase (PgdA/CDA1 family)
MINPDYVIGRTLSFNQVNEVSPTNRQFSYCSKDRCLVMDQVQFQYLRQMPSDIHHACIADDHYAMTFDDGPSTNFRPLLALLAENNVKATFFVNGVHLKTEEQKELIREAFKQGHQISNHTQNHPDLTKISKEAIVSEANQTQTLIAAILNQTPQAVADSFILRPPFGYINPEVQTTLKAAGYQTIRWNGDRYDWELSREDDRVILKRMIQQFNFIERQKARDPEFNTSVLDLNHDHSQATLVAVQAMILEIKNRGYQFVTVSECLGLQSQN